MHAQYCLQSNFRYQFPESVAPTNLNSVFMHIVLDFSSSSKMPFVYLSDIHTGYLVVLDTSNNASWRITSNQMKRKNTNLKLMGSSDSYEVFTMRFGITGIAMVSSKTQVRKGSCQCLLGSQNCFILTNPVGGGGGKEISSLLRKSLQGAVLTPDG
jgi:hypothetical protein